MGKVINTVLAKGISSRIDELLSISGLSLLGLSVLCDIGRSSIKSYYGATLPISAELLDRICNPYNISLSDFFAFKEPLSADLKEQPAIKRFYKKYEGKGLGYFIAEEEAKKVPVEQSRKHEREKIAHIVLQTKYFDKAHPIKEMLNDFAKEYDLVLESGRLYELLAKYVDKELEKRETTKYNQDGSAAKLKVYMYKRKEKR